MAMALSKEQRLSRWYFGGLASAGAACCTHPLDLLKVTLFFLFFRINGIRLPWDQTYFETSQKNPTLLYKIFCGWAGRARALEILATKISV